MTGEIKTFLSEKQYGFIKGDDGKDYFFHQSKLKNRNDIKYICEEALVSFEQKATPKGYNAVNIEFNYNNSEIHYITPDKIFTSKQSTFKGWEVIEYADWLVHGSSRESPDEAKDDMILGTSTTGANALINVQYYKTTGSEAGTGSGTYYYTIHNFKGQITTIAKKNAKGEYKKEDLLGLDEQASKLKAQLVKKSSHAQSMRIYFWLILFIIIGAIWIINEDIATLSTVGLLFIGYIFSHATDYDSWLEKI